MKFALLLVAGVSLVVGLAGCARERSGIVTRVEGKATVRVAGAEVFLVKESAEAGLLAPAKAAAAAKEKEVNERLKPEIARAELALTKAIEAQSKLPEGKAPNMELGGDEKRNVAMNALMAKQKELYLARLEVNAAGFAALRGALPQAPVGVTTADGAFTVTLRSDDVVLILDAKTKSAWRTDPFNGTVTLDEGRRVVFP